ncbi:DNA internalization-related competence protein ComEC/Rec2 [Chloroflexota bacterium]
MLLIYLSCAWLVGILLGSKFNLPLAFISLGLIPLPLLFFTRYHRIIIITSLCLVILLGGVCYSQASLPAADESHIRFYNDCGTVEIKGLVDRDPELGDRTTQLYLSAREIKIGEEWHDVSGTVLLSVPRYPAYAYGDLLQVTGGLKTPQGFDEFDYKTFLEHQGIYSTIRYPGIEILETGQGFKLLEWVYSLRNSLSGTIAEVLPEPQASLAQGIILGIRENIPQTVQDKFAHTGTAHLLAISGLHLSIVAGILLSLGIWLFGRRGCIYIWLALGVIWLYALLTGLHPPVFRAAIMVSLYLTAELLGRQRSVITALVFAAAVMVGINPQLLWNASFQMSFAAMAGLVFVFPLMRALSRRVVGATLGEEGIAASAAGFVADSFSVSMAAIIAVWPLIAYYFGIISPIAPLATLFALPALPGIIITGALAGVVGLFALPVAQVIAWLGWLFTSYMLLVVNVFNAIPTIEGGWVNPAMVWIYYAALALILWIINNRHKAGEIIPRAGSLVSRLPVKWLIAPLLVVAILVSVTAATLPDDRLHTSFLDVGEGDAILIQKGSQQILVDGGPSPRAIALALSEEMPFWDRTIDLVILTHPHADHATGLLEVLNRYEVKQVLFPALEYESGIYDEWLSLVEEKGIEYTQAQAGQRISLGPAVTIEVLSPRTPLLTGTESDIDNNSLVLRLGMGEISFLLTADIMRESEFELIYHRAVSKSTVLKVAHHGSATSTGEEFLVVGNPQLAVISVGADNTFGHPASEVIDRLEAKLGEENIYRTDENGTIEFTTDGERLWVEVER